MLDWRHDSARYEFLSCAARKPARERTGREPQANPARCATRLYNRKATRKRPAYAAYLTSTPTRVQRYFHLSFGLILPPGAKLATAFAHLCPFMPATLPGWATIRAICSASLRGAGACQNRLLQPFATTACPDSVTAASRPPDGNTGKALVYRLPCLRSNSTLSTETETPSYKHPKSERVRIRGQLRP
jgi:hypothetical protein